MRRHTKAAGPSLAGIFFIVHRINRASLGGAMSIHLSSLACSIIQPTISSRCSMQPDGPHSFIRLIRSLQPHSRVGTSPNQYKIESWRKSPGPFSTCLKSDETIVPTLSQLHRIGNVVVVTINPNRTHRYLFCPRLTIQSGILILLRRKHLFQLHHKTAAM
jgi:hypothetical protein